MSESQPTTEPVEWRDVPGFPGYRASSDGRIETRWIPGKRSPLSVNQGRAILGTKWEPVKLHTNHYGYLFFNIPDVASPSGKPAVGKVHTFVCLAFHGIPKPGEEVRHFPDNNKLNNRPDNLKWGTHLENLQDMKTHGTQRRGERHQFAKLTESDVRQIWVLKKSGWTVKSLAAKFGASSSNVSNILAGRAWSWLKPEPSSSEATSDPTVKEGSEPLGVS